MWYVVWVRTGQEEKILRMCEKLIDDQEAYESCFIPKYQRPWKEKGKWITKEEILFPGYLFFVTGQVEKLSEELREIPEFTKVLGDEVEPIPLYEKEIAFLQKFINKNHVIEMSVGDLIGGELVVTEGPLKDYQGKVVHIDRHKRLATLEVDFFGRFTNVVVGLEIVRKVGG